ncbi:MAG: hypothetical protein ACI9MR_002696 [Myxococcota bacterium]|jgi:hypothetical protein
MPAPPRPTSPAPARHYSVPDADALVPYLTETFAEIAEDRAQLSTLVDTLADEGLDLLEEVAVDDVTDPRFAPRFARVMTYQRQIRDRLQAVEALGAEVRDLDGRVEVASRYNGRDVYLCWELGDPAFDHWREVDADVTERLRVGDFTKFTGSWLN